jgi:HSP20 family molecular chaperone IbpA
MSENPADEPNEPDDDRNRSQHWLDTLLSALDSLERRRDSLSQHQQNDVRLDYDVSINSARDRAANGSSGLDRARPEDGPGGPADRPRTRRQRPSSPTTTSLTTRSYDGKLVVTADIAGLDPDEITVGFDGAALVIGASGTELDRVDVPWPDRTASAAINNGVLTVIVEPDSNEGDDQ